MISRLLTLAEDGCRQLREALESGKDHDPGPTEAEVFAAVKWYLEDEVEDAQGWAGYWCVRAERAEKLLAAELRKPPLVLRTPGA